jgi:pimeloyl-ACP methyl ester carboxylesterase
VKTVEWALVQPEVAKHTRACSYDRAGTGFSDPGTRTGTSLNIVDDLHRLLKAAGIAPPYILVGHS